MAMVDRRPTRTEEAREGRCAVRDCPYGVVYDAEIKLPMPYRPHLGWAEEDAVASLELCHDHAVGLSASHHPDAQPFIRLRSIRPRAAR